MLKNKKNQLFQALMKVQTTRRICLTGSPFQNNLSEYFRMVSYIRPGLLGTSEALFLKDFAEPIEAGMALDARQAVKDYADELLVDISTKLHPHVHRRDATVLLADLPSLQHVCLHVKPTKVQRVLYVAYRKVQKTDDAYNNFLKQYSNLRSIHNHPGTLLRRCGKDPTSCPRLSISPVADVDTLRAKPCPSTDTPKAKKEEAVRERDTKLAPKDEKQAGHESSESEEIIDLLSDSEQEETLEFSRDDKSWWTDAVDKLGTEALNDACSSNKFVLLLHLLCHTSTRGEKTVLFTQCLRVRISRLFVCCPVLLLY
jgi:SNF2 family DNA or RNA helicase